MDFGEVLGKSWKIIWKHKVLWLFGLLASCSRASGGGSGGGGGGGGGASSSSGNGSFWPGGENLLNQLQQFFDTTPVWLVVTIVLSVICLIVVVAIVLGTIGRIGLVRGAWQADEGVERLTFGQLLRQSLPYFWRVLLLVILFFFVSVLIGLVLIVPVILLTVFTLGCGLICLIPLLIVFFWLIEAWLEQSIVAVVGEDLGVIEGLQRGWSVIQKNPGQVAVMALILNLGAGIVGVVMVLPVLAIVLPALAGAIGASYAESQYILTTGIVITVALLCLYIPVALLVKSVVIAYLGSAWTLTFRRLTGGKPALDLEPLPGGDELAEAGAD